MSDQPQKEVWEPFTPWLMLRADAKKFGRRISPELLSAAAELFLVNGDLSAWLYTGSQAMHSERILIFEPIESKLRKAGVGHYGGVIVGLKRRFNNVWVDADKQMQMDMILGLKHQEYFPHTYLFYREDSTILLDYYPESDEERDLVGKISWPKPEYSHKPPMGSEAPGSVTKSFHTRSYSTTELFAPQSTPTAPHHHHNTSAGGARPPEAQGAALSAVAAQPSTLSRIGWTSLHHHHSDGDITFQPNLSQPNPSVFTNKSSPHRSLSRLSPNQAGTGASSPLGSPADSHLIKTESDVRLLAEAILGSASAESHHRLSGLDLSSLGGLSQDSLAPTPAFLNSIGAQMRNASTDNLIDFEDNVSVKSANSHERASAALDSTMQAYASAGATFTKASADPLGSWSGRMI